MLRIPLMTLLCGLLLGASAQAADLAPQDYGFPLHDPFEATIATTPPQLRPELPDDGSITQRDYALLLRPEREYRLPDNFWAVKKLHYRLAWQDHEAPLVFIIAGTGSNYRNSTMEYLKKLYWQAGYHVVQLSSPTSYDFMASASRWATPGLTSEDADDLYRVMQAVRANHPDLPVSDYYLVGYSLGGLHAAFVSKLDEERRAFNFKRVLMLNPPVNLYTSVTNLDRLVQTQVKGVDSTTTFYELMLQKLTRYFQDRGYLDLNEAMLYDFQRSPERLSDEQMAMLIGTSFRFSAADIAFTSDLINRRGLIIPPGTPIGEGTSLTPYFKRAMRCDFDCYMNQQLIPLWHRLHGEGSFSQMVYQLSLTSLQEYLHDSPRIRVMHNADDLILGPGDLTFLRQTLGDRLTVYPYGGHCGNLNYRVNAQAMLDALKD